MTAWMVRGGDYEAEALVEGMMSVDWNIREDIGGMGEGNLRRLLQNIHPTQRKNETTKYVREILRFRDTIKLGEVVVMPLGGQEKNIAIGIASGGYEHLSKRSTHMIGRPVTWLIKDVPRMSIGEDLKKEIEQRGRTVLELKSSNAEERLRAIAGGGPPTNSWDEFVRRAKTYVDTGKLAEEENDYKLEIGTKLSHARDAVVRGSGDWASLIRDGLTNKGGSGPGNLIAWQVQDNLRKWCRDAASDALTALRVLWARSDISTSQRVHDFTELLPSSAVGGAGTRANVVSVLLMGVDVERYPPFRRTSFEEAYKQTEYDEPNRDADEANLYEHALVFLDTFIDEAAQRGLKLRHRLDAQSVIWALVGDRDPKPPTPPEPKTLKALAGDVFLAAEFLEEIVRLLEDKKQVIFQGPPGTGKTFVAQSLADYLAGDTERVDLVQFHPSYAYEDFIQGFRPKRDGQGGFDLRDGPLLRMAKLAADNHDDKHYLIIDEINRGNLAKVFGELYFLLEYRNRPMRLQYSDESFSLPPNLYIIGTMNTADRSIALVDLALRRRFHFMEFKANESPIKDVLRKWLAEWAPDMAWIASVVDRANELLNDQDAAIGPSYFMKETLDEDLARLIWEHNVMPYIAERLFGQRDRLVEFALDRLRNAKGNGLQAGHAETEDIADVGSGENDATD